MSSRTASANDFFGFFITHIQSIVNDPDDIRLVLKYTLVLIICLSQSGWAPNLILVTTMLGNLHNKTQCQITII